MPKRRDIESSLIIGASSFPPPLRGRVGEGGTPLGKRFLDDPEDAFGAAEHLVVPEPKDSKPLSLEP